MTKQNTAKVAPKSTTARAKTLSRADQNTMRKAAEAAAVEERLQARRKANARWYAKQKAGRTAAVVAASMQPQAGASISKAQLIATLEVQLVTERSAPTQNRARIDTLETTLRLAKLLS